MNIISKIIRKFIEIKKTARENATFKENISIVEKLSKSSNKSKKIIIDCGFNQGIIANKLLKGLPGFSLVGFEIQQDIQHFFKKLSKKVPSRDINVIYSAISDHNGTIEYYEPIKWGKNYKGGTTTVNNKDSMTLSYSQPKIAPCIDFSEWIRNNVNDEYFVFIKMDIEGAEYDVIEHLMKTGAIDLIDVLAVEWHANKFPELQKDRYIDIEHKIREYAENARVTVLDWY